MAVDPARAHTLFLAASEISDPEQRAAYLHRECGGDRELLARVHEMLRNEAPTTVTSSAESTADHPALGSNLARPDHDDHAGQVIAGRYTLIEPIGEGGMGSVWRAQQTEPVRRFVAVKLIKEGMDSRQVLARFDAERQALAMMDHPHIAKVLDGGLHDGRPFFVMELVQGTPITRYCDQQRLNPRQRLELFVGVCQAIQHAHQKGIIHRDIKPSNVLVALYDDKPVVKVIDFGVAKAIGAALTDQTIDTGVGRVVGTPQYMSPEQASFDNLDVDTRSDVYSLGVLLYELLAGTPPFTSRELAKKGMMEILRVVREDDPPRPSSKVSTADALPNISANRGVEPKQLTSLLREELDWVVMKALEKDRDRRYETANGFAADVLRYLSGEPVQAHPPSASYRARKFVRRHRTQVIAASLVALALLAGITGTTWGLFEARRQEAEANRQTGIARDAAAAEKAANAQAQKRLAQIEKGNELLTSIFQDLDIRAVKQGAEPLEAILAQRLLKAAEQLEGEAIGDPLAVAQIQNRLGSSLVNLGYPEEAIGLLTKARQTFTTLNHADSPETLGCTNNLAVAYGNAGKLDLALPLLEEVLTRHRETLGADHPTTLVSTNALAWAYLNAGKPNLATPLLEEALRLQKAKLGADDPDTLISMSNLASAYQNSGKLDLAIPLFEQALTLTKAKRGADSPDTLVCMSNLADAYRRAGKIDLALPLIEETLTRQKASLGADHPSTLNSMHGLARAYTSAGKSDQALPLLEETVRLRKAKLGADHPDTLNSMNSLAAAYRNDGKLDLALPLFEETLTRQKATLGANHPSTITSMSNLATTYLSGGRIDLALPLLEETLALRKATQGADHPDTLTSMIGLAVAYQSAGKRDLALPLFEEIVKLQKAKLGADHPDTVLTMCGLASAYAEASRFNEAVTTANDALAIAREKLSSVGPAYVSILNLAGRALLQAGAYADAEPVCRECLTLHERDRPDHWRAFDAKSMLGGALLGQKQYADAEPLLLNGYEGMVARAATITPRDRARVADALDRLIELYNATDKPDEVARYKALRASYPPADPK